MRIWPSLPPAGDAHDDQLRVDSLQDSWAEPESFHASMAKTFDDHLRLRHQLEQSLAIGIVLEVKADALLVATIDFPPKRLAIVCPVAQGVALRALHLDDLGAKVRQLKREHVARHKA